MDAKVINAGKFNKNATASERKEYLMNLLKAEKNEDEEGQDEVPTDKQINQMIARSEEEYKMFQQMDKQREAKEREAAKLRGLSEPVPRLLTDAEVPPEMKQTLAEHKEQKQRFAEESYGRGMRKRGAVSYADDIPEDRWLQLVDEGKDVEEYKQELAEKRKQRGSGAATTADTMAVDDYQEDEDDDMPDEEDDEAFYAASKKRKRAEPMPYHFGSDGKPVEYDYEGSESKRGKKEEIPGVTYGASTTMALNANATAPVGAGPPIRKIKISAGKVTLQQTTTGAGQ